MRPDYLFIREDLSSALESQKQKMFDEIDGYPPNDLLNSSVDDLCDYFEHKYHVEPVTLRKEAMYQESEEVKVDVSQDPMRFVPDRSRPAYITGTQIRVTIPFDGEADLFKFRPSTFTLSPPAGQITNDGLRLSYTLTDHNAERLRSKISRDLADIEEYLGWVATDVGRFNVGLRESARSRIDSRRTKLLKDQNLVAELGIPIKRRDDAPKTYTLPEVRRKPPVQRPPATTKPFTPEPTLDMAEYEHILHIISNMAEVMERSPKAFATMEEEDLRQHFLVQLNAQYEGQATGETFNFEGKTDILIRAEGRNVFIAECKFWRGPKVFLDTVDQLLNYASWRDTKTAILLFNRERDLSKVLEKIPEVVKQHPSFKRRIDYQGETGFRFVLHHKDDVSRELILTVLVFEVPA